MSPVSAYVILFMAWTLLAAIVWAVAAILLIRQRTRPTGRRLFWAMAGTYPGVFVCQIIAAPVVAAVLVLAWLFWRIIEPGATTTTASAVVGAVSLIAAMFVICFFGVMSMIGFYQGWRIGWAYGSGGQVRIVQAAAPVRWLRTLLREFRTRA